MKNKIKASLAHYKHFFLGVCLVGVFMNAFLFNFASDLITLFLIGLWILTVWLYRLKGRTSIIVGLVFLIFCPFLLIMAREPLAEKFAVLAYMFLVIGVGQEFIEYLRENRKKQR